MNCKNFIYTFFLCLIILGCRKGKSDYRSCELNNYKINLDSVKLGYMYFVSSKLKLQESKIKYTILKDFTEFIDSLKSFNSCGNSVFFDSLFGDFPGKSRTLKYTLFKSNDYNIALIHSNANKVVDQIKYTNKYYGFFFTHKNLNDIYCLNFNEGKFHRNGFIKSMMKLDDKLIAQTQMRVNFNSEDKDIFITKFIYDDNQIYEGEVVLRSYRYKEIINLTKVKSVAQILDLKEPENRKDTIGVDGGSLEPFFKGGFPIFLTGGDYQYTFYLSGMRSPYKSIPDTWVR